MIRILVLARDRATSEGIAAGLAAAPDVTSLGTTTSPDEVLTRGAEVDLVVVGSDRPPADTLRLARAFRADKAAPCLVVTGLPSSPAVIAEYVEAGVDAYLTDDLSLAGLLLVIRLLDRGEVIVGLDVAYALIQRLHSMADLVNSSGLDTSALSTLTKRETQVLELIGAGLSNKEIAHRCYISVGTAKSHVHSVLKKLHVRDRQEARRLLILARSQASLDVARPDAPI